MKMLLRALFFWSVVISMFGCSSDSGGGGGDSILPTITAFTMPATATSLTVPVTTLTATDDTGVTGYMITTSATAPSSSAVGWTAVAPVSVVFAASGVQTAFAWAKDAAGNVSASMSVAVTITLPAGVASVALQPGAAAKASVVDSVNNATLNLDFPATAVSQATTVTVSTVASTQLPAALGKIVDFTPNSANTYVTAFKIDATGITVFNVPIQLSGSVATTIAGGTVLNVAIYSNNTWIDISTVTVAANGAFTQSLASATLPGITTPGTYLVYKPAAGTSTAVSNLGIALIADDGAGYGTAAANSLQVINLYDSAGNPLATPTIKYLTYASAGDIDGQALTPDGSQGIIVDGGNTVRFFSNVQTGVPVASTTTVSVSNYGGDGDSVAIMPNGDEAVVSADSSSQLLIISGITAGNPKPAEIITIPGSRDGLVISNDGKVLLARGSGGLTVYSISAITPVAGSLGGTISHSFTKTADIASLGSSSMEDGRNGIASSPNDSSRAVTIGYSSTTYTPQITPITGLTGAAPSAGTPVTLAGATSVYSVSVTPDGKSAVVGTDSGIVLLNGVDTGTLQQVGTAPYAPTFTVSGSSVTLKYVPTLGITLDGKYVVICSSTYGGGDSKGTLLVIPITYNSNVASGFGTIVGQLNGIAVPGNDQMVIH